MSFGRLFSTDPRTNQSLWRRSPLNPVIPAGHDSWCHDFVANSTVLTLNGELAMYVEGSSNGVEQIGVYTCRPDRIAEGEWAAYPENPIVRAGPDAFDRGSAFDPAVVRFRDRYFMYYSATEASAHSLAEALSRSDGPDEVSDEGETIGLAVSSDGYHFRKARNNPLFAGRCPHAVVAGDVVYMYYVRVVSGGYRIFLASSSDGFDFREVAKEPVLDVGEHGEWDSHTVTTPKIFREENVFFMLYAADSRSLDDPTGIGAAFSTDLIRWTKIPGNPIFTIGEPGHFDSASVSCPIVQKRGSTYVLLYAGSNTRIGEGLNSQIGMSLLDERLRVEE